MPYADLPGVDLWYTDSGGSGIPVILMHAASGNTESWVYQTPVFAEAGYRCIAYDRNGWGQSKPKQGGEPAVSPIEDLHNLLNHLGLQRPHLAGTAAGARPALEYVLAHPERIGSLVLADCGAGASAVDTVGDSSRGEATVCRGDRKICTARCIVPQPVKSAPFALQTFDLFVWCEDFGSRQVVSLS